MIRNVIRRLLGKIRRPVYKGFQLESELELCPRLLHPYNALAISGPTEASVFADLSFLKDGDEITFEEYLSLDSEEKLFCTTKVSDEQKAPIFHFPVLFIPKGYILKVIQTRGTSKVIKISAYRR